MAKLYHGKSFYTTEITRDEAQEWFKYLEAHTDQFIRKNFKWQVKHGFWPIKARKKEAGQKNPKFAVVHHTSNKKGNYKPALNRFFSAKKASAHFLLGRESDQLLYLISVHDMAYHATRRSWLPIAIRRALKIQRGWIDEVGIEVAGNGGSLLFSYDQLLNLICLLRYLAAYFPSLDELKSHRFFSRISRAGDPGPLLFLPLIEHAVFTDVDLGSPEYWIEHYRRDPVKFANEAKEWMVNYKIDQKDEWIEKRKKKITSKYLLK